MSSLKTPQVPPKWSLLLAVREREKTLEDTQEALLQPPKSSQGNHRDTRLRTSQRRDLGSAIIACGGITSPSSLMVAPIHMTSLDTKSSKNAASRPIASGFVAATKCYSSATDAQR